MEAFGDLLKKKNMHQLALVILAVLFLLIPFNLPDNLVKFVDNMYIISVLCLLVIVGLYYLNPVVSVALIIFAIELVRRSKLQNRTLGDLRYIPSERKKSQQLNNLNEMPETLEEQIVSKMVPVANKPLIDSAPSYKPVYESVNNASEV